MRRLAMLVASLLLLTAVGSPTRLTAPPREAAVAVVLTPGSSSLPANGTALLGALAERIERATTLRVLSPEQAGLELNALVSCPPATRLSCWTRVVGALSFDGRALRYLIVLSVSRRQGQPSTLSALSFDVAEAARLVEGAGADAEDAIYARTVRPRPVSLELEDAEAARAAIAQLADDGLEAALAAAAPPGTIELRLACAECVVELDEQVVGATGAGDAVIERVPAGRRALSLRQSGRIVWTAEVWVEPGARAAVGVPEEALLAAEPARGAAAALWWGGGAAGALGVAGVVAGAAVVARRAPYGCVVPSAPSSSSSCVRPDSDAAAPLLSAGTGLLTLGAAWVVAAAVGAADDEPGVPWVPIALGVAGGALGATVMALSGP